MAEDFRVDYVRDVKPLLKNKCYACHGPDEAVHDVELRLDTKEGLFGELESGDGANPAADGEPDELGLGLDAELDGALESFEQQVQEWDDAVGELHQALYEAELHLLHGSPGEAARLRLVLSRARASLEG